MTRSLTVRVGMGMLLLAIVAGFAMLTTPRAEAAEADACGGHNMPVCKSIKSCVSVNGSPFSCTTDYYYYPDAS